MKWTMEEAIEKCREFEWSETGKYCSPAFNEDGELEYIIFERTEDAKEFEERYGIPDGVDIDFTDNGEFCCNCGRWIPNPTIGTYDYWIDYQNCEVTCKDCIRSNPAWARDYIETCKNNPKMANTLLPDTMLQGMGWYKYEGYENGWYGRENDPEQIMAELNDKGLDVVFSIRSCTMFQTDFDAWTKPANEEEE